MILDSFGKPIKTSGMRPIKDEIAVASIRDKYSTYPSNGLTPEKLARILKEADSGDIYRQMELFEEIEEKDLHLMSVMGTRKNAVLGCDYEVISYSDDALDQEIAKFIGDALYNLEDFDDALMTLLDAIGKGFAVTEIMWGIENGQVVPNELKWRHQKKFRYDDLDNLRLITDINMYPGLELPENKFIVHRYKARSGYNSRAGVFRTCVWMYLFKNYTIKDWVAFSEVYGMPIRIGKYEPSASEDEKETLINAILQIGSDAAAIIPESTKIEFVQAMKTDGNIYESLAKFCNAEISKAILGQTQTSEVAASGSLASSKVHETVRQDILEADCKALSKRIQSQLIRPMVLYNYGQAYLKRLPVFKFACEKPEDQEKSSKVYQALSNMGLPIATQHVYERFGIPKPEDGDEILKPQVQAQPAVSFNKLALKAQSNRFTPTQQSIEHLADCAFKEGIPIIETMIAPILKVVAEAESLEALKEKLLNVYPEIDTKRLEDLTAKAMFVADLYGRWSADE